MLFSSLIFLFVFLPIVLILYHVVCGHSILAKNYIASFCQFIFLCLGRTEICFDNDRIHHI